MEITKPLILIVDDNAGNIKLLMETFANTDYSLRAAKSGARALQFVKKNTPDIILLDILMPEMDGYEVCERLKGNSDTKDIPVIFITALRDEEEKIRGFEAGAVDYITKPFYNPEVKARVRTHLELKLHREHLEQLVRERTEELQKANAALRTFLRDKSEYQEEFQEKLRTKIDHFLKPCIEELKETHLDDDQIYLLETMESNVEDIIAPFGQDLPDLLSRLTPSEIQIANLIRQGKTSKEISILMRLSIRTVDAHRFNIRKKMGIINRKTSLRAVLSSFQ